MLWWFFCAMKNQANFTPFLSLKSSWVFLYNFDPVFITCREIECLSRKQDFLANDARCLRSIEISARFFLSVYLTPIARCSLLNDSENRIHEHAMLATVIVNNFKRRIVLCLLLFTIFNNLFTIFKNLLTFFYNLLTICLQFSFISLQFSTVCLQISHNLFTNFYNLFTNFAQFVYNFQQIVHVLNHLFNFFNNLLQIFRF